MIGIYKITSPTNRVYIGQSWNIPRRRIDYQSSHGTRSQVALYNSIQKHGWINHRFEVIHELPEDITQDVLDRYEVLYWELYRASNCSMLNIKEPGEGGKHSEDTKQKMREKRKLQVFSEESKEKMSKSAKAKDLSIAIANVTQFQKKGEGNPRATLTEEQVRGIKLDAISGIKRKDIVIKYNTKKNIVDCILLGTSWKHVNIYEIQV